MTTTLFHYMNNQFKFVTVKTKINFRIKIKFSKRFSEVKIIAFGTGQYLLDLWFKKKKKLEKLSQKLKF